MEILVKDIRGDVEDTFHLGIITIVDYKGNILYSLGDHDRWVFSRSSAKPIQALSVLQSGAYDEYGLTEKELALLCASHSGEVFHEEGVRSILEKAGLDESFLQCGTHLPSNEERRKEFLENNITPKEVHCNCSGKHSGMLITAKKLGLSLDDYYKLEHPVQERILENFALISGVKKEDIKIGIDGCGVPVHALPMKNLAYGYARLANPKDLPGDYQRQISMITEAMTKYPEMVSGTDKLCTDLMKFFGDRLFAKAGANGFYNIGLKKSGIGIAIKLLDGDFSNMAMVVIEVLKQLGVIDESELENFNPKHLDRKMYNHRKEVVGEKIINFDLNNHKFTIE